MKQQENKEKILAAALNLFTRFGVDATPTARISKEAGVSTGTLFHYFPDKHTLVNQLYLAIKREMSEAIRASDDPGEPPRQRLVHCMRGYIAWGIEHPDKVRFLDQFYNSPGIGEDINKEIHEEFAWMLSLIENAVLEGVLPDLPPEFFGILFTRVASGILTFIASGESGMSRDEIIDNGLALILR
jgi:AcrR family transcriptional regulator